MGMPLHPTWEDIALRLILTLIASAIIGFDRGARGHAAGLRTTILVGLAASVAMIQANILLSIGGKTPDSFGVMDLMRMPLGILTGVGFIGGGTILRRGDLVTGVTTAATLWATTVIGLCLGGGQLALGIAATILAVITLWALIWIEVRIPRDQRATLVIKSAPGDSVARDLSDRLGPLGYSAKFRRESRGEEAEPAKLWFEIGWRRPEVAGPPWDLVKIVNENYSVVSFELSSEARH
ncbi:MAG TPA: MgtC/SapB family protein [Candidatus Binataceae bacterium]|nr:MgtC/SapB family protein [Candidatus Binataceae bacterium]